MLRKTVEKEKSSMNIKTNEIVEKVEEKNKHRNLVGFLLILALVVIIYIILLKTGVIEWLFVDLQIYLQNLYQKHPFETLLIIFSILLIITVLAMPAHMILSILTAIIIKDFAISFIVLLVFSLIDSCFIFLISHLFLHDFLLSEYKDNVYIKIFKNQSRQKPFRTSFLVRLIFISAGLKDYVLSLINNPFHSFFISALVVHGFFCALFVLVAQKITELKTFFQDSSSWNNKSFADKFEFITILVVVIFTMGFAFFIGFWISKKVREHKDDLELKITPNNENVINLDIEN